MVYISQPQYDCPFPSNYSTKRRLYKNPVEDNRFATFSRRRLSKQKKSFMPSASKTFIHFSEWRSCEQYKCFWEMSRGFHNALSTDPLRKYVTARYATQVFNLRSISISTQIVKVNTCRGQVQNASPALRRFYRTYHVLVGTPLRRPKGFYGCLETSELQCCFSKLE